ncbi:response regulator [Acidocella sp. MX-AZ03]|nr:response regulator [Acidocella sp. MX-AZ03]WBO59433.1 response regulator [Acidocella sp. MX-AZ03]
MTDLYLHLGAELIDRAQTDAAFAAARKVAEEASAAKTRFLAAAGHDLRQPLQTIGLLKSVLERQVINPPAFTTLAKLDDAVRHMQDLVESMLDASQIESGTLPVELADIRLWPLLLSLADDFAPAAAARGIVLRCVPCSATIRGDRRMLARILSNLLNNALKYTDKGKVLMGCRRRGAQLRIEIWDTGAGIRAGQIGRIFDEFTRLHPAGNEQAGLGLGLHIVKRFCARLGYETEVQSTPGRGSMFALIILHPHFSGGRDHAGHEKDKQTPWILLIQDDPAQRDALQTLLSLESYQVRILHDIAALPEDILSLPLDVPLVIVADKDLPGKESGTDLVRQIRASLLRQIPTIMLCSRAWENGSPELGDNDTQFILKPVQPHRLLGAIEQVVSRMAPGWRADDSVRRSMALAPPASNGTAVAEIAVIDDEESICGAVRDVLEAGGYGVEAYSSAEAFLADPARARFRCIIIDVILPGMSGAALQTLLKTEADPPRIIFLTGSVDLPLAVQALRNGASDFLHKPVDGLALLQSVMTALRQQSRARIAAPPDLADRLASLTPREREVMERVVRGELNKNIAVDLGISERTTEHHRQSVMRKMGTKSLAALVRLIAHA